MKKKNAETVIVDEDMNKIITTKDGSVVHALGAPCLQLKQKPWSMKRVGCSWNSITFLAEPTEPVTEEEAEMMRTMGFCNFGTTKGKHVIGNSIYVANIAKQRKYRQYMNRRGGFNRPLDPVA